MINCIILKIVTPYGGVWIEINSGVSAISVSEVTPYGGVWIEMLNVNFKLAQNVSRLMEACGLK